MRRQQAERKASLVRALVGAPEPTQPRDPGTDRFVSPEVTGRPRTPSYDGGGRQTWEPPKTEEQVLGEHGKLIGELVTANRQHRSGGFG